ncbi:MAG: glycosyltransferase [Phycisphaerales bacterium]|nr:glycosyltransferase [Phycisphaerales bacterium]
MRFALVHEWFKVNAGSEKVVGEILSSYPDDDITVYTLFSHLPKRDRVKILNRRKVIVSPIHYFPYIKKLYRYFLPLLPGLIHRFKIENYDFVLSSSHAVAKGFRKAKDVPHLCYCHTPMRYAWDLYEDYSKDNNWLKNALYRSIVQQLRKWDLRSVHNVDVFLANSINVQERILKNYGRTSEVLYPPVNTVFFHLSETPREDFYLCVGRFVPYKKVDVIVKAFQLMPEQKLILIGDGHGARKIRKQIKASENIKWLGYQNDFELLKYMQKAKACIFAAKEDFGIMCVEAQACGTPVIALNYGGHKETVIDNETGYFFEQQNEQSIKATVLKFEQQPLNDHKKIRTHAEKFSADKFRQGIADQIIKLLENSNKKTSSNG